MHVHKTKAKINFPLLDVKEEFVEQINIQVYNEIHNFLIIELDIIDSHNLLDDDEDIKEQVTKFVESIPSQLCDILVKTNPEEEEIQAVRDFINDSFEDVIIDILPDIPVQINNSRRDQDVEPTKKQIYYSTDDHKRHVEEMVLKFIDLVTVRDDHPFTPVDILLNQCKDSKLFSKFDMIMGYFQVLINPEHAKYTAFITHIGKFEYTRMPQGLVNSPSTFARLMVEIFWKNQKFITIL
ncbi:hypothetical protein ACTFIT_003274 [Dictyostelium discoideum]